MIEQLEKVNNAVIKPVDKRRLVIEALAQELGVPVDKTLHWLDALYITLGKDNQEQKAIDYLTIKIEMKKLGGL